MTVGNLLTKLRTRLQDTNDGQWSASDKRVFLNSARLRTIRKTGSYKSTASVTVVNGTHTYTGHPVFSPEAVRLGDEVWPRKQMGVMPIIEENWDALPAGTPTRWIPVGGSRFRVAPTPDAGAAGIISTVSATPTAGGTGYAVGDVLEIDEGSGGKVEVLTLSGSAVATLELHSTVMGGGKRVYDRGTGYSTGTGKATTKETGAGSGCTVNITALAKLEVYGPASVSDLDISTACTVANTGDLVTSTAHGLAVGDPIAFGSTTGGFTVYQTYYVKTAPSADTFTVSATLGGATFNITADGSNTWGRDEIVEIADAHEDTILHAAVEEARAARPHMPGSQEARVTEHQLWEAGCADIEVELGIA